MQAKKGKIAAVTKYLVFLPAIAIVLMCLASFLPNMGMDVLRYKILKFLCFVILGLSFAVVGAQSLWRDEQVNSTYGRPRQKTLEEVYESRKDHTGLMGIIALLGGIVLLIYGGSKVAACVQDMKTGPVRITLESTQIGNAEQIEAGKEVSAYYLYGTANQEVFKFRISAGDADENLMRKVNYKSPEIIVIYYPKTKAIEQIQIFFEENDKVVLPYGERAYDSKTLEKLPVGKSEELQDGEEYEEYMQEASQSTSAPANFVPMKQEYSEVEIEDLGLPEIAIGDNYKEVSRELMALPEGERYESALLNAMSYDEYFQKLKGVISEYGITQTQGVDILYKDDMELIFIYNSETYAIETFLARRCLITESK